MLHLRRFTGFSIHLEYWNTFRFGQSNKFWKKSLKKNSTSKFEYSQDPIGDVLGTSWINLPGTSLELQIKTSPGRHLRTSPGRQFGTSLGLQIGTSLGRSGRTFSGRPGDVWGGRPQHVLGTNICRLGQQHVSNLKRENSVLQDQVKVYCQQFDSCCDESEQNSRGLCLRVKNIKKNDDETSEVVL